MGVRDRVARFAGARPRPFVVAAADGTGARLAAEAEFRSRGWRAAASPTETGFLVVCGTPGPVLAGAIGTVWDGMPGARARVDLRTSGEVRLVDAGLSPGHATADGTERTAGDVPMAGRADDRDGLRLDVLHVPLGPVLAWWPAGLRLDLVLQGDIVQHAEAVVVDTAAESFWDGPWPRGTAPGGIERRRAAARLDSLARFLRVAGWDGAAGRAAVLRDETLAGAPGDALGARFAPFARRVGRSRTLRWMTRGLGVLRPGTAARYGMDGPRALRAGDVKDRVDGWLLETGRALERLADGARGAGGEPWSRTGRGTAAVIPALVEGGDVAAARLVVASLDPDPAGG
ncbi:hypothetical protein [Actinomadura roseirufa]|uniref:hypothetical protein n=1 Tax=Actinomadura roseirufa TaxID=2094049 RepID=UPI0010413E67|nr:hypothetical protein [Actinomadura roseirufa]